MGNRARDYSAIPSQRSIGNPYGCNNFVRDAPVEQQGNGENLNISAANNNLEEWNSMDRRVGERKTAYRLRSHYANWIKSMSPGKAPF